jgi:hypothetical protein
MVNLILLTYKTQSPAAAQQWATAVANDDIDITQRYGEGGFYLQHYTTQGKPAGLRGNKAEVTAAANQYLETHQLTLICKRQELFS